MPDSTTRKKRLTPDERKKRYRRVMINRALFASACIVILIFIIYVNYLLFSFISSVFGWNEPEQYVISGENQAILENDLDNSSDQKFIGRFDPYQDILICLDAGHGGYDGGAQDYYGNNESHEVLQMTLLLKEKLEDLGINTIVTRDSDEFISLSERCTIANDSNAALLLSIHRNFYEWDDSICGIEAWINSSCPDEDYSIAEDILEGLANVGITNNRGIKYGTRDDNYEEDYVINSQSDMPSIILEMGYMSNEKDNQLFKNNMEDYCEAIANAIANWYLNQPS